VRFAGDTIRIENFDLWYTPRHRNVPIYLSAVFQKGIALCGEVADGIILTRSTLDTAALVRTHLVEGASKAGRDPAQIEVTSLLPASVGETREAALAMLRPGLAFYCGFFPRYNRMMAEHGFATEAAAIRRGLGAGGPRNGRTRGERRDDRRDQRVGHTGSVPRPDRGLPAIRHRRADHQPLRPRSGRQVPL
jgi:alkanesulfonate monooxygenase SsuD/methylene tetrahydromethanopterin reductase-like flavin-dependent oxidoreductase (luciferase family)